MAAQVINLLLHSSDEHIEAMIQFFIAQDSMHPRVHKIAVDYINEKQRRFFKTLEDEAKNIKESNI